MRKWIFISAALIATQTRALAACYQKDMLRVSEEQIGVLKLLNGAVGETLKRGLESTRKEKDTANIRSGTISITCESRF